MYDEPRRACVVIRPGHCYWQNDSKMIRLGCASLWSGGTPPIYSPSNKSHLSFLQEAHTDSCCGYHGNMLTTIRLASTIPNTVNGGDVQSCTYTVPYWIKMHTQFFCLLILPPSFEGLAVLCTLFSDIFFLFLYFSEHGAGICDFRLDK